jgi:hypothetical protein
MTHVNLQKEKNLLIRIILFRIVTNLSDGFWEIRLQMKLKYTFIST